jgi:ABC-2 type transport system ATP-binding protein
MTTAIKVDALTMSYADRQVLKGVDFEVKAGEVFCLLGPNGAGKTTTVEILEGFRRRTGGTVSVLGMDPHAQPARLRERIGIVLQECGFPRQARVAELIDSWRGYYRSPRDLEDLLKVVELAEDRNVQVRRLSGGQRRRLDLALALAGDPELIFLDEPTTGFDPESRRRCWAAIENLRSLGKTIVLTTHYLDEAERLADRVAILLGGRIQVAGTVRHVARQAGIRTKIKFTAPERVLAGSLALPSCLDVVLPPRWRTPTSSSSRAPQKSPEAQTEPHRQPGLPPGAPRTALVLAQRGVRAVHLRPADRAAAAHRVNDRHRRPAGHECRRADDLRPVDHRVRRDRRRLREPGREARHAPPRRRTQTDQDHPAARYRVPVRGPGQHGRHHPRDHRVPGGPRRVRIFDPTFPVPHWLSAVVGLFPVRALAQILQQAYTPVAHAPLTDLFVLLAWTAAGCGFAAWRFRWH